MPNDDYPFDYGNAPADDYLPASPGSTAPQPRIVRDAPTVQMRRPATPQRNPPTEPVAYPQRGQQPYTFSVSPYDPDTYDPSPAKPDRRAVNHPDGMHLRTLRPRSLVAVHPRSAGLRAFFAWAFSSLAR